MQTKSGNLVRYPIISDSTGMRFAAENGQFVEGKTVAIAPKAPLFYILMAQKFVFVSGGVDYASLARAIATRAGIKLQPAVKIGPFQPGRVLERMGCIPDFHKAWQIQLPRALDHSFQRQFLEVVGELTLNWWLTEERIDMLTAWVFGGPDAIRKILAEVNLAWDR